MCVRATRTNVGWGRVCVRVFGNQETTRRSRKDGTNERDRTTRLGEHTKNNLLLLTLTHRSSSLTVHAQCCQEMWNATKDAKWWENVRLRERMICNCEWFVLNVNAVWCSLQLAGWCWWWWFASSTSNSRVVYVNDDLKKEANGGERESTKGVLSAYTADEGRIHNISGVCGWDRFTINSIF